MDCLVTVVKEKLAVHGSLPVLQVLMETYGGRRVAGRQAHLFLDD
jgi:hypothetical protein